GVILSTLADRFSIRKIFIISAIWSGCANLLFALFAHDYSSAMLLRALTGIGMGGTYMPGLKLVAERFDSSKRGRAIGIYVGSLVLGASFSLLVTGTVASFSGWRISFIVCSAGVLIGVIMSFKVFKGYQPSRFENARRELYEIGRKKPPGHADGPRIRFSYVGDVRNEKLAGPFFHCKPYPIRLTRDQGHRMGRHGFCPRGRHRSLFDRIHREFVRQ